MIIMESKEGKTALVWKEVQGRTDHPTAEEIYQALRSRGERISLPTVYRALRSLAAQGLLATIPITPADRFDPQTHPHYHFHCLRCGRLFDLDLPYQPALHQPLVDQGYEVHHHTLVFHGLCLSCREKEAS